MSEHAKTVARKYEELREEIRKSIIGQDEVVKQIIIAIMCDANALLESYPGLGKTLLVKTLSQIMTLRFSRIQNTPDLMPSDITGTFVLEESRGHREFKFQKGPIFANIILADEINRATPKTQAALLEAMQEKQVTVGNETFRLDRPFFVLATQNPIDQEGTYPLPEAQTDRFLMKIKVDYPASPDELQIVDRYTSAVRDSGLKRVLDKDTLLKMQQLVRQVPISDDLKKKVVSIVNRTRTNKELIEYGASPRASLGLVMAAKAHALIHGRAFVSSEDISKMAYPILRHRIILSFRAERAGKSADDVIAEILKGA